MTVHIDEMTTSVDAREPRRRRRPRASRDDAPAERERARRSPSARAPTSSAARTRRASMTEPFSATAPVFKVEGAVERARARRALPAHRGSDRRPKTLELRLVAEGPRAESRRDEGQLYLDGQTVDFGKPIEVSIGPADAARIVFDGDGLRASRRASRRRAPDVTVFAEDALMRLRMTRRMRPTRTSATPTSPARSRRARPHGRRRRRRADLRRRAAVEPERPRVPARAGPADPGRALVRRTTTLHFATRGNRTATDAHAGPGQRPARRRSCAPTSRTSAPR